MDFAQLYLGPGGWDRVVGKAGRITTRHRALFYARHDVNNLDTLFNFWTRKNAQEDLIMLDVNFEEAGQYLTSIQTYLRTG